MRLVDRTQGERHAETAQEGGLEALVERHRAGDPAALNALMGEIYPTIHRMVYRLAGPRSRDAHEDLVQAALEQVCRSLDGFEGRSRVSTFVFGICHRVVQRSRRYERVRHLFRREAEAVCVPHDPEPLGAGARPDEALERGRALRQAWAALDRLGAEERSAFVLHEVEDLGIEEVAVVLGCSTRTVKRRLHTARGKLLETSPPAEARS
jgi:RNA polymerase sigma-70 factor (ECF subfamily)